jgi:hypothetical protein
MHRDLLPQIWLALDPHLRMELLECVAHGGVRKEEYGGLYHLAETALMNSAERVLSENSDPNGIN